MVVEVEVEAVVVVVLTVCLTYVSVQKRPRDAPNSGGRTPGSQDSRRPRHPFPALMAGEPLAVYLCTRP